MSDAENLHDTTDAAKWAAEFCARWPLALCQIPGKEGVSDGDNFEATMIGWFANAIMAGVDSEARKSAARVSALVEAVDAAVLDLEFMAAEDDDAGKMARHPLTKLRAALAALKGDSHE